MRVILHQSAAMLIYACCIPPQALSSDADSMREPALIAVGDLAPSEPTLEQRLHAECPHAIASQIESQRWELRHHRFPPVKTPARPALREDLLLRAQLDQQVRESLIGANGRPSENDPRVLWMRSIDQDNLTRLHHIVHQDGFPTAEMVGYDGVSAAWLILQHAVTDAKFQASMLPTIEVLARHGELSAQNYALLADRVRLAEGKKQRFGTQFTDLGDHMKMEPLEDPIHVDQRRARLGLPPLADYTCLMRVLYRQ